MYSTLTEESHRVTESFPYGFLFYLPQLTLFRRFSRPTILGPWREYLDSQAQPSNQYGTDRKLKMVTKAV